MIASGSSSVTSAPDPYVLGMPPYGVPDCRDTNGKTMRSLTINPAVKTLVLIMVGQSNFASLQPTLYTPTNTGVIDNFNIYDGAAYQINAPLIGCTNVAGQGSYGPGNVCARLADYFIINNRFARVILVPIAVSSTKADDWGNPASTLYNKVNVAMRRLAARGVTPATTGVTFTLVWGQGESDQLSTSQASYAASLNSFIARTQAVGMSGRIFVNLQTWNSNATSAAVRAAQASVVGGSVYQGADADSLNGSWRMDGTHFSDTGADQFAILMFNAMVASGAPF